MPRVSEETLQKLQAFIDSLPAEARSKCALCNETLTHIVKTAEVETGAGTATVARVIADKLNEDAALQDRVSGGALQDRVRRNEGLKMADRQNNPEPKGGEEEPERGRYEVAMKYARMAVLTLENIQDSHPDKKEALAYVQDWINKNR